MAVESIGALYPTKIPGYADAADIQAALRAYHYGSYTYDTTNTSTASLEANSIAKFLFDIETDITALENRPSSGGEVDTTAPAAVDFTPAEIPDGFIWVDQDGSLGGAPTGATAVFTNSAPTTSITTGTVWVDKDATAITANPFIPQAVINAKGDLIAGSANDTATVLPIGTNGQVLKANSATTSGLEWGADNSYSAPTLGSTSIASGATVTTIAGLTLTSPTISTITNTGSLTLPTSTDTLVGRATTDTLTNKTLTSPTLTTPSLGVATATSINGTTIPSSKTLLATDSTISDGTTSTAARGVGYMGVPQSTAATTGAYTITAADAGEHIYSTATRTITIDSNTNLALPVGTAITFIAATGATVTIAITSDTLILAGPGTTGSRTLAPFGMATAIKITSTSWIISGNGLT
jgi:hypothetical protein